MSGLTLTYYRWVIGSRVQAARTCRGLTVPELAEQADIPVSLLAASERGLDSFTVDELEQVALALRVPLTHFMGPCVLCGSQD